MIKNFRREVTDSSFARAFGKYFSKRISNNNGENTDEIAEGYNVLNGINEKEGLTREEIDSYINKYPIFSEFYDEEGFELELDTPNYKTYKPTITNGMSVDEISQQAQIKNAKIRKKVRDNMLIDMISACLSSPAGSQMSIIPGSYNNIKHTSREQRILKDPAALEAFYAEHKTEIDETEGGLLAVLHKYSTDELDSFYEKKATVEDPLSIVDYCKNHRNLMDGNDLIGMFAVN